MISLWPSLYFTTLYARYAKKNKNNRQIHSHSMAYCGWTGWLLVGHTDYIIRKGNKQLKHHTRQNETEIKYKSVTHPNTIRIQIQSLCFCFAFNVQFKVVWIFFLLLIRFCFELLPCISQRLLFYRSLYYHSLTTAYLYIFLLYYTAPSKDTQIKKEIY